MIDHLISGIRSFIDLQQGEIDVIKSLFKPRTILKGDLFLDEGQVCKHAGFIVKGVMRYYINDEGEERTYAFAQENDFVCNYESFIPKIPSSKIIQALEDCEIFEISYDGLQEFYRSVAQGERLGRLAIEQVFIHTLQDLSSFYTDSHERRYLQFAQRHADLQQRISQYHIASYVGVKPQSLSRIRKRIFGPG